MRFATSTALLCSVLFTGVTVQSGKIIYPWRATSAIVKAGETFNIWFDADAGQTVNAIELQGPFSTVHPSFSTETGSWVYDEWSSNTYNQIITVTVPENAPADRYDLVLKTSAGDEISLAALSVITEYRSKFYIFHMSDLHRWQSAYDTEGVILHEQSAMVEIANILNPAMVIETGDNIYPNSNVMTGSNVKSTESRINQYINGDDTYLGMNDFIAPVFSIPGNHDTPSKSFHTEPGYDSNDLDGPWLAGPAQYWNDFFGLQNHNFTYGDARFVGINNGWCPDTGGGAADYIPNYQWQLDEANDWLKEVGPGTVQVAYLHVPQESVPPLYKALENGPSGVIPEVMLAGHIHNAANNPFIKWQTEVYCTYSPRDGSKKVPFNLFQVDTVAGTVEPVGNSRAAIEGISTREDYSTKKLTLSYAQNNDGSQMANTATLVNNFDFPIEGARVRFVMAQGADYAVSSGEIQQAFDGDSVHVVDIRVDLSANGITSVSIGEMGSMPNQAQFVSWNVPSEMDPGETAAIEVIMKNTGQDAWTTAAGQKLGSTAPVWGVSRIALPGTIQTNQNAVFLFTITAPATDGYHDLQWQMIDEAGDNAGWFGSKTPMASIKVGSTAPVVTFDAPSSGTNLNVGDNLYVHVNAVDSDDIERVWLYKDGIELPRSEGLAPYEWGDVGQDDPLLQNLLQGSFVLTARARDRSGEEAWSAPLTVTVGDELSEAENLVQNPSFENGSTGWQFINVETNNTAVYEGNVSLRLNALSDQVRQTIPIETGTDYRFSFRLHTENLTDQKIVADTNDVYDDTCQFVINSASSGWKLYSGTFRATTDTVTLRFFTSGVFTGAVYVDDVSLVAESSPSGYEIWAAENSVTGLPLEDHNSDGWNNLLEYALDGVNAPYLMVNGNQPVFNHLRRNGDENLFYEVEVCTNLMDGVWVTNGITVLDGGDKSGTFDEISHTVSNTTGNVYIRLKVGLAE